MYDLLIENARICDGTGAPSFHGCVAVKDGVIAAVGKHSGEAATKTINADGLVLAAPGSRREQGRILESGQRLTPGLQRLRPVLGSEPVQVVPVGPRSSHRCDPSCATS